MEFLQPIMLLGLLGISIPILIHLWNGRRGRTVSWAAMQWLEVKENKPQKTIKLEQWLLLILRVLLIMIVVFILSNVLLKSLASEPENQALHLVQPSEELVAEFRFEIQQAIEKGEAVYWMDEDLSPIYSLEDANSDSKNDELQLQKALDEMASKDAEIHLYLVNSSKAFNNKMYFSQVKPILHLSNFISLNPSSKKIKIEDDKYLTVNYKNQLNIVEVSGDATAEFVWDKSPIPYYVDSVVADQLAEIEAALTAIEEVYLLSFQSVQNAGDAKLIFDKKVSDQPDPEKLYFVFTHNHFPQYTNIKLLNRSQPEQVDNFTDKARLPEQILENLVLNLGLEPMPVKLSEEQIYQKFLIGQAQPEDQEANTLEILWVMFVLTLIAERILSVRKQL